MKYNAGQQINGSSPAKNHEEVSEQFLRETVTNVAASMLNIFISLNYVKTIKSD